MKEAYRDQGTVPFVEHTVQDIRLALRQLAKSPGLAATAILVLALGMGGCLTVFGFVEAALLRPLPYAEPDRLVDVTESDAAAPAIEPVVSGLPRLAGDEHRVQQPRRLPAARAHAGDAGRARDGARHAGQRRVLPDARHPPDPRPRLQRRRVRRRGRQGRGHHASNLAGALRRRSDGGRPQRHPERRQLRHHRRPAAHVPVRAERRRRVLDADRRHRRLHGPPQLPQPGRRRAPRARGDHRRSGCGDGRHRAAARTPVPRLQPGSGCLRRPARRRHRRRHPADAVAAARRRRAAAGDRLHQRGQPAAGADGVAAPRAVGAAGAGRVAGAHRAPLRHRSRRPRRHRRRARARRRRRRHAPHGRPHPGGDAGHAAVPRRPRAQSRRRRLRRRRWRSSHSASSRSARCWSIRPRTSGPAWPTADVARRATRGAGSARSSSSWSWRRRWCCSPAPVSWVAACIACSTSSSASGRIISPPSASRRPACSSTSRGRRSGWRSTSSGGWPRCPGSRRSG